MAKIKASDLLVINRNSTDYKAEVSELGIPSAVSELTNDAGYITLDEVPPAPDGGVPEAPNDGKEYARQSGAWTVVTIPTDNSELTNGAGYITADQVEIEGALVFRGSVANEAALPGDAVQGDLYYNENDNHLYAKGDSDWYKVGQVDDIDLSLYALKTEIPTDNAGLSNGAGYITLAEVPEVELDDYALKSELPTDNASLSNGAGYITADALPTDNADLDNGAGYITAEALPKDTADLTNGAGYITLSDLPDRVTINELPALG